MKIENLTDEMMGQRVGFTFEDGTFLLITTDSICLYEHHIHNDVYPEIIFCEEV
jgi:hypothetical protein